MKKLEVKKHLNNLIYNWFDDEKKDYSSLYNIDYPDEIKTEKLKNHNYKDLRVLIDFLNTPRKRGIKNHSKGAHIKNSSGFGSKI